MHAAVLISTSEKSMPKIKTKSLKLTGKVIVCGLALGERKIWKKSTTLTVHTKIHQLLIIEKAKRASTMEQTPKKYANKLN